MRTVIGITGKLDAHGLNTASTGYELYHHFFYLPLFPKVKGRSHI